MNEIKESVSFSKWLNGLKDPVAKAKIAARIDRLALGNAGDVRPIGGGLSKLRIHYGPGYRVYYVQRGQVLIIVLCGGDKATQERDIETAKAMASKLE